MGPTSTCYAGLQKDNFFTQARLEPKYFYPKKCLSYDKSTSQQNSVKGPKEPNSAKKNVKTRHKVLKCAKNATKKRKCVTLLTS